jgi:predicted ATPase/DNA-binding SARP family transcriptional activator
VRDGEQLVEVEGAKARALLVLLLLHANDVVPSDRLIDDLWSGSPPSTAANALQVYVSRLRKLLGREAVVTRAPGYQLQVEPDRVDALRFSRLVEEAREALADGRPEAALAGLEEALALWQGAPLAEFVYEPFAQAPINRLEELRLTALEEDFEARLALGRGADLVADLEALVAEHPLRERLRGQLMLALYRAGRQAEALELYQETRRLLVEELGIEPSPSLQRLETAILRQDPALEPEPAGEAAPPPEAPSPPRETRKTVTVLFLEVSCDGEQLDPEARATLLDEALERANGALEAHGGTVTELPAGRLLVVFGVPTVREDDSLRAVRGAADVRDAIDEQRAELVQDRDIRLAMRAGIDTGEVVAGASVTGEAVAAAARLQEGAAAGEILVGGGARELLRDVVSFEPSGQAFRLVSVSEAATTPIVRRELPLVGRERELARLEQLFEQVAGERDPMLVTLLGPAGIGKSRLAAELGALVEGRATVLGGRCLPYGKGITFWPLAEIVRAAAGATTTDAIAAAIGDLPDAALIARRVAAAVGSPDAEAASDETFWAIRKLLEALARERPLVLVFDDLQWAEPTLLDLLDSLADLTKDAPVMVLCLARPELLEDRPSWGGGKVNAVSMLLGGLSGEESDALISQVLGGRELASSTRARVAEAADGNPLFLEQMLAMLAEHDLAEDDHGLPPTIQALLAARLDRLDPDERAVIERASVIGKEFVRAALAALADADVDETAAARALDRLVRRDLLRPGQSDRGEIFRFRHSLIRETAYGTIPKRLRAVLHERFATWLEGRADRRPGELEEIIGYHLEQAYLYRAELGPVDDDALALAERAAGHLATVGERAYERGDGPAAANLLSRAAALLASESRPRLDLLVDLGEALRESGEFRDAEDVLGEAIAGASALDEPALEARAFVVRLRIQMQTEANFAAPELLEATDRAIEVLERAGDERGLAKAWPVRAWFPWLQCDALAAEQALLRGAEHARRAGDERAEGYSLNLLLGSWLFGPVPVPEAVRRSEEILALPPRQQRVKASAYRALAGLAAMEGRFDEARELLELDRAIIEDMGLRVTAAVASEIWGIVEMLAGEPAAAERRLLEGYAILEAMGEKSGLSTLAAMLAHAVEAQGRHDEAYRFTEISEESAPEEDRSANVYWLAARAKLLARRGEPAEGEALARKALALAEPTDFLNMRGQVLMDLGEVLRLDDRAADAAVAVADAVELYELKGNRVSAAAARAAQAALATGAAARRR